MFSTVDDLGAPADRIHGVIERVSSAYTPAARVVQNALLVELPEVGVSADVGHCWAYCEGADLHQRSINRCQHRAQGCDVSFFLGVKDCLGVARPGCLRDTRNIGVVAEQDRMDCVRYQPVRDKFVSVASLAA